PGVDRVGVRPLVTRGAQQDHVPQPVPAVPAPLAVMYVRPAHPAPTALAVVPDVDVLAGLGGYLAHSEGRFVSGKKHVAAAICSAIVEDHPLASSSSLDARACASSFRTFSA